MAALKKSGEEEWKKKIPRLNKNTVEENKNVLNTIVTSHEENNKNNNSPTIVVNNNGDNIQSGMYDIFISSQKKLGIKITFKPYKLDYHIM